VNPSADKNLAILNAIKSNHTEVARLLLQDNRVKPSGYNNIAIRWAVYYGRTGLVNLLLQDPLVDITDCAFGELNAVEIAKTPGHPHIAEMLVEYLLLKGYTHIAKTLMEHQLK
jgi:ankyrin repeat protein